MARNKKAAQEARALRLAKSKVKTLDYDELWTDAKTGSDDEEAGGIALDLNDETILNHASWPSAGTVSGYTRGAAGEAEASVNDDVTDQQMIEIFHQSKTPLDQLDSSDGLWRLPATRKQASAYKSHGIAKFYEMAYRLIFKYWHVDAAEAVPEEMRKFTPYSMALFVALRRLASHSQQQPKFARDMLVAVWQSRLRSMSLDPLCSTLEITYRKVGLKTPGSEFMESHIQETNLGLTLDDVAMARSKEETSARRAPEEHQIQQTKRERKAERKASRKATRTERGTDVPSGVSKSIDGGLGKRQTRKEKAKAREKAIGPKGDKLLRFLQEESGVVLDLDSGNYVSSSHAAAGAVPPNSPTRQIHGIFTSQSADANPFDALTNDNHIAANGPVSKSSIKAAKMDRHHDTELSGLFNKVNFINNSAPGPKALPNKKIRRLAEGGYSGRASSSYGQKKENFAQLPTLYQKAGEKNMAAAMEGLEKMGLDHGDDDAGGEADDAGGEAGGGASLGTINGVVEEEDEEL